MASASFKLGSQMVDSATELIHLLPESPEYLTGKYEKSPHVVERVSIEQVSLPSLTLQVKTEADIHDRGEDTLLTLVWLPHRSEWIARISGTITVYESAVVGYESFATDQLYRIPEAFGAKLLETYGVPAGVISPAQALRMSPADLEVLGARHKGVRD
jgi:hypothetical protein